MGFDMYLIKTKKAVLDDILKQYFQKDVNDLLYANDTYVFINKEHYDLMLSHCGKRMEYLKQYIDDDISGKRSEYMECERLFYFLQKSDPNWSEDVVLYEHDY